MNKLYNIEKIEVNENELSSLIKLNVDHEVFDGHFPERSVLPGVIELEIIKVVLSSVLEKTLRLKSVKNAKYLAMILPDEISAFYVTIEYILTEEGIKTKAVIKDENNVYLKFNGVFIENE